MAHTNHQAKAVEHVDAVKCTLAALDEIRMLPDSAGRSLRINRAHDAIRQGLKLAEIHATLAISEQLSCLASRVEFLFGEQARPPRNWGDVVPPPADPEDAALVAGYFEQRKAARA